MFATLEVSLLKSLKSTPWSRNASYPCPRRRAESSEAKATAPKANATAKSFLILPSLAIRKFSPTLPTAARLLSSPILKSATTAPIAEDNEATRPYIEGLIVREFSKVSSNWRSQQVAEEYLEQFKIPVLAEIDTRALVRHLRDHGVMRGVVSTMETDRRQAGRQGPVDPQDGWDRSGESGQHQAAHTSGKSGERSHLAG